MPIYENIELLGEGCFAKVYKCTNEIFAKKIFKNQDEDIVKHEIEILKKLNHRNIIKYKDEDFSDNKITMITEYIDGLPLDRALRLNSSLFNGKNVKDIMIQLLSALNYLHDKNISHGDVTLNNIMVKFDDSNKVKLLKLIDFGCASSESYKNPMHISIEAIKEERSSKTDVWLAGMVLVEMLSGPDVHRQFTFKPEYVSKKLQQLIRKNLPFTEIARDMLDCNENKRISAKDCLARLKNVSP